MSIAPQTFEHRTLLHNVPWETYQSLRVANPSGHLRMTFDRGELEIMSPSRNHERISYLVGRMIDEWTLLHDIEVGAGRNTTFSREDLLKGLEPDNCYWITHELVMRDKDEVDLSIDPPPDLVLEVDVTRSSIPKLPIYLALGVPEVWRWRHETLDILRLDDAGQYQSRSVSTELPSFPFALAIEILGQREGAGDTTLIRQFIRRIKSQR
ncbi:MAG: Uma2 family endonuclease [Planctomycetaceae bacterium]|nr:Uma2 family endonuclease [Planctomycetaceae bacterium]